MVGGDPCEVAGGAVRLLPWGQYVQGAALQRGVVRKCRANVPRLAPGAVARRGLVQDEAKPKLVCGRLAAAGKGGGAGSAAPTAAGEQGERVQRPVCEVQHRGRGDSGDGPRGDEERGEEGVQVPAALGERLQHG